MCRTELSTCSHAGTAVHFLRSMPKWRCPGLVGGAFTRTNFGFGCEGCLLDQHHSATSRSELFVLAQATLCKWVMSLERSEEAPSLALEGSPSAGGYLSVGGRSGHWCSDSVLPDHVLVVLLDFLQRAHLEGPHAPSSHGWCSGCSSSTWWMLLFPLPLRYDLFFLLSLAGCPVSLHQQHFPLNPPLSGSAVYCPCFCHWPLLCLCCWLFSRSGRCSCSRFPPLGGSAASK